MNTKNIVNGIIDFSSLEKMGCLDFLYFSEDNDMYSNEGYIEHFKHKGFWFWFNVIRLTNLPIKYLYKKYFNYMNDFELFRSLMDQHIRNLEDKKTCEFSEEEFNKVNKNILKYLYEYIKYNPKINI